MADTYDWTQLHHIHCVVRAFSTGAAIDPQVYGSLLVWPANTDENGDQFDFADLLPEASLLIRIGPVFVFGVMDDSGFAVSSLKETIAKVTGPLTKIQGREMLARICHRNISLEPRPTYHSRMNLETGEYTIGAEISNDTHLIDDPRPELYGTIMAFFLENLLAARREDPQVLNYVRSGHYTFLFGEDGKFLAYDGKDDILVGPPLDSLT
jgi:hypothetical protein